MNKAYDLFFLHITEIGLEFFVSLAVSGHCFYLRQTVLFLLREEGWAKALQPIKDMVPEFKKAYEALREKSYALLLAGGGVGLIIANNFANYSRFPEARNKIDKYFVVLLISFAVSYLIGEGKKTWLFKFARLASKDLSRLLQRKIPYTDDHGLVLFTGFAVGLLLDAPLILLEGYTEAEKMPEAEKSKLLAELASIKKQWDEGEKTADKSDPGYKILKNQYEEHIKYLENSIQQKDYEKYLLQVDKAQKEAELEAQSQWVKQRQVDYIAVKEEKALLEAALKGYGSRNNDVKNIEERLKQLAERERELTQTLSAHNAMNVMSSFAACIICSM
ncbi:hypothetical protein [Thermanaerosceptrum fracticalcis]|uniref:hypothetical protein n=1 Tax=Thermanaerosceptrum fracticalcis TaxID=1712410 RepID=UPI00164E3716|nr:hypothetical protein [Thermanaerosceptrum fracticalcis]